MRRSQNRSRIEDHGRIAVGASGQMLSDPIASGRCMNASHPGHPSAILGGNLSVRSGDVCLTFWEGVVLSIRATAQLKKTWGVMTFEVELKFRVTELDAIRAALSNLGAVEQSECVHVDRYFNHPARDFHATDEAFRIRSVGDSNCLTYKGAVVGQVAKTRHEIEIPFADGIEQSQKLFEMVRLLGFRFVREVCKSRKSLTLDWNGRHYDLALDDVPPLGQFLEIELIAEDHERETAEKAVWSLAHELDLNVPEPRSYLNLLIESEQKCL